MRGPSSLSSSSSSSKRTSGGGKKAEATPCCSKVGLKRGPWTAEEDELLADYIKREGEGRWRTLPKKAGLLRCGKSCRLRWMNYLRPSVKRGHISPDEEDLILRLHRLLGNRWSLIAGRIPGRTDNEIKNYWNTHLSKKLISQGIDPKTHKPFIINSNHDHGNQNATTSLINDQSVVVDREGSLGKNKKINVDHVIKKDSCDEGMMMMMSNTATSIEDDDDMMMLNNCCPDDAFSSFLDSLINDDMFSNQLHQDHHQEQNQHQDSSCFI